MDAYFFGQRKVVPTEFAEWLAPDLSAAVSIDMHRGHLGDSPECPCPAPRAREIIEPITAFHRAAEFPTSRRERSIRTDSSPGRAGV